MKRSSMSSGSMVTEMSSYPALFDELEKIAEQKRKYVTKDKFKRHLMAVGATAGGSALGHFAGSAAKHAIGKNKGSITNFLRKHPKVLKHMPMAVGALGAGGAAGLLGLRTKKHLQYAEKGNDDKR